MTNRSLRDVLFIVWVIAAVVAVLLGIPTLLIIARIHVDANLIVNVLVTIGTFTAAGVALLIATADRRERKRERDAEDKAHAKLVVISALRRNAATPQLKLIIRNLGPHAIVDAEFVSLLVDGHEHLHLFPTTEPLPDD